MLNKLFKCSMMNAGSMKDFVPTVFYIFSFKHASDYVNDDDEEQKNERKEKVYLMKNN